MKSSYLMWSIILFPHRHNTLSVCAYELSHGTNAIDRRPYSFLQRNYFYTYDLPLYFRHCSTMGFLCQLFFTLFHLQAAQQRFLQNLREIEIPLNS